ncbi:MAG: DEAD/DEAH box helicase [Patescibacteria group bacterium]
MTTPINPEQPSFSTLGISPKLLQTIAKRRFQKPTLIQMRAIPVGLADRDLVALSGAGTGRTLAFGIPMIQNIARRKGVGWVVVPFAGLAAHVDAILQKVGREAGLRTLVLVDGLSDDQIKRRLARKPHIIIGQPASLLRCLESKLTSVDKLKVFVCDEAERLFESRYAGLMERLLSMLPGDRQLMAFFSVSSPSGEEALAKYTRNPEIIKTDPIENPARRRWPRGRIPDRRSTDSPIRPAPKASTLDLEFAEFRPAKHYGSLGSSALTNTHKQTPATPSKDRR